jgi:hypothetical protein
VGIERQNLSLAGEYAVASELCRRGFYAQVTLGRLKRTDLLVYDQESDRELRIEVKSKQGRVWPGIKGITGSNAFLVFVDFEKKKPDRADFYILNVSDWRRYINKYVRPEGRGVRIDENYCPTWKDGYIGTSVKPNEISKHKEAWDKLSP